MNENYLGPNRDLPSVKLFPRVPLLPATFGLRNTYVVCLEIRVWIICFKYYSNQCASLQILHPIILKKHTHTCVCAAPNSVDVFELPATQRIATAGSIASQLKSGWQVDKTKPIKALQDL